MCAGKGPDTAGDPVVELEDVTKSFGGFRVLHGVGFAVHPRETFVIIGRSGSGKSVTLRHMVGLTQPDAGTVRLFGNDMRHVGRRELAQLRLRLGFLFQTGALLNWMTIEDNVALPLVEHRKDLSSSEILDRVIEKLRLVGMESARSKLPSEISGGMKKRAALARATVLDPALVLYDEPTSGLDPVIASTINELINRTKDTFGTSQVVVTHDMESAYSIGDRIAMLYEGRIVAVGTPDEIQESPEEVVQQFIHGRTEGPLRIDN